MVSKVVTSFRITFSKYIHSTVQLRYPKLLVLSVMSECEGFNRAISVLLSRFKNLPRVCYYDNACNMLRSIAIRLSWINDKCLIVCDRFHYKGHIWNSVCDPDSYLSRSNHLNSSAESLNSLWNLSKSQIRNLNGKNMMAFLSIRSVFTNLRTVVRKSRKRIDIKIWT